MMPASPSLHTKREVRPMKQTETIRNGQKIVTIHSSEVLLAGVPSALDFIMTVRHTCDCDRIALEKSALPEDFFILSTCLAGEMLQKIINYGVRLAIFGDFSRYTSKPLKDFIYECNHGKDIFFLANEKEAIEKLAAL